MGVVDWISKKLKILEEVSLLIFVSLILAIIFFDVLLRYGFNQSLTWGEELARFLFIATTYIGASAGVRTKGHIVVDLVIGLFPKTQRTLEITSSLLAALFSFLIFATSAKVAYFLKSLGQTSTGLSIPVWIPYMGVAGGSLMMAFRFVEVCLRSILERQETS